MRPLPIYSQLSHLHNSTLQYASTASILKLIEKSFKEMIFSSNIIKTPKSLRDGDEEKGREKKKKNEKSSKSLFK
jgi:hypothetical protein